MNKVFVLQKKSMTYSWIFYLALKVILLHARSNYQVIKRLNIDIK